MGYAWEIDVATLELFYKVCEEVGAKTKEEKEIVFFEIMKAKGKKPMMVDAGSADELAKDINKGDKKAITAEELLKRSKEQKDEDK